MLVGAPVALAAVASAPTATAHHAYEREIGHEAAINEACYSVHCSWDASTAENWKAWVTDVRLCLTG